MRKIIENLVLGIVVAIFLAANPTPLLSQQKAPHGPFVVPAERVPRIGGETSEKSLKVDSNVNLSLCVTQGKVTVNSWKRHELRVFVHDGSKFGFKVLQKSEKTGDPVWVTVMGVEARKKNSIPTECISGGEIEIDVPTGAAVNIKGEDVNTTVDGIRKVSVQVSGGSISMRNIAQGIGAKTYQGGVTVEESKGPIEVETTNGNIVVFETGPSDIGDILKAKTNGGMISLQKVEHRQIEVNSISGSVAYNGAILSGGSYSLTTSNGSIRMSIPQNSACTVNATYGYGRFETDLPIKIETENITPGPVKTIVGRLGAGGDAVLKLTSNNGSIAIRKQP
jgi:hypothetical protein